MSTSPRLSDHRDFNVEPKEFGKMLNDLVKEHNDMLKLNGAVHALGKTQRLQYPNGHVIGRKEIRSLSSQFVKKLRGLKKYYTAHGKRKKRARRPGTTAGFKNPILVSDNMRQFFSEAEMKHPELKQLAVGQNGVTTRAILTPLFTIYAHLNGMQQDPTNKQFLTSTPLMDKYFAGTYRELETMPQRYTKPDKNGVRKPIPKFDPKHFRFANIQQLVAKNTRAPTEQEKAVLESPDMKARLEQEQTLVSGILEYYRWEKSGSKKPFEQWAADERAKKEKRRARG